MDAMSGGTPTSDGQEILDYFALADELDLLLADDALHLSDPAARRRYYDTTTRYTDTVLSLFGEQSRDVFTVEDRFALEAASAARLVAAARKFRAESGLLVSDPMMVLFRDMEVGVGPYDPTQPDGNNDDGEPRGSR
jgi:hypothetical protein